LLPEQWKNLKGRLSESKQSRVITDYIAGMTDGYLKREYQKYFD
jgi:dGTP triphosphohydrolase